MLIWADCIPCLLKLTLETARLLFQDEVLIRRLVGEVLKLKSFKGEDWEITPPEVARDIWIKIHEFSGVADPLKEIKKQQSHRALEVLALTKQLVLKSRDPLLEALKFAIAGNSIDAMMDVKARPIEEILKKIDEFAINPEHVRLLKEKFKKARRLLYIGDNCGEIVFDKLLIQVIRERYDPEVIFVTRSLPALNDATFEDAVSVGINEVARILENGIHEPLPGTMLTKVSPELKMLMEGSDMVISKGGGNYETLTDERKLRGKGYALLTAKCRPLCIIHQVPLGAPIVSSF